MSSINRAAFRITGLFALITSVVFLSINVFELSKITTIESLIYQVIQLAIDGIGIYGGLQLVKLRKIGHQLLIIWLLCKIFTTVFVVLALTSNWFFGGNSTITDPLPMLTLLTTAYYLLSPVVLVYLLASRRSRELLVYDNPRHTRILLTLLSLLIPGLARALVNNLTVGMILFYVYCGLVIYLKVHFNPLEIKLLYFHLTNSETLDFFVNFLNKVVIWCIFARLDWKVMENYQASIQLKLKPVPDPNS